MPTGPSGLAQVLHYCTMPASLPRTRAIVRAVVPARSACSVTGGAGGGPPQRPESGSPARSACCAAPLATAPS